MPSYDPVRLAHWLALIDELAQLKDRHHPTVSRVGVVPGMTESTIWFPRTPAEKARASRKSERRRGQKKMNGT